MSSRSANGGGRGHDTITVEKEETAKLVQEAAKGSDEGVGATSHEFEAQSPPGATSDEQVAGGEPQPEPQKDTTPTKSKTVTRRLKMRSEKSNSTIPLRNRTSAHTETLESRSTTRASNRSHNSSAERSIRHHPNATDTMRTRGRGAIFLRGYPNVHGHRQDNQAYGHLSPPLETRESKASPLTSPESGHSRGHGSPVGARGRGVAFRGLFNNWVGSDWRRRRAAPVDTTPESVQDSSSDISQSDTLEPLHPIVQGTVGGTEQEEVCAQIPVIQGEEKADEKENITSSTPIPPQSPILGHRALSDVPANVNQYRGQQKDVDGPQQHRQTNIPTNFDFDNQGRLCLTLERPGENSTQHDKLPKEKKQAEENMLTNGGCLTILATPPVEEVTNKLEAPPALILSRTHDPVGEAAQVSMDQAASQRRRVAAVANYIDFDEYGHMSRQQSPERSKLPEPAEVPPVAGITAAETTQDQVVFEPSPQFLSDARLHIHVNEQYQEVIGHMTMAIGFGVPTAVGKDAKEVQAFKKLAYQMASEKLKTLAEAIVTEEMTVDWNFESDTGP
ncbi:hypothetical protein BCR34DRAFT_583208 [Clohesyomyces aquaticus]|uniref:Uncharacterized protein n=1 Tax=Clohesyomyces aquaticus TaxID=1231657 RepID=A0A1Y2A5Z5_9PLEO|nr:hypothetical protein BCR34DRAFT_583208 [Clohesyomyces aquaticus]